MKFIYCSICPCVGCVIDKELFKKSTGAENIPPDWYCKKQFENFKPEVTLDEFNEFVELLCYGASEARIDVK